MSSLNVSDSLVSHLKRRYPYPMHFSLLMCVTIFTYVSRVHVLEDFNSDRDSGFNLVHVCGEVMTEKDLSVHGSFGYGIARFGQIYGLLGNRFHVKGNGLVVIFTSGASY